MPDGRPWKKKNGEKKMVGPKEVSGSSDLRMNTVLPYTLYAAALGKGESVSCASALVPWILQGGLRSLESLIKPRSKV